MRTVTDAIPSLPVQRIRRPRHFPRPGTAVVTALLLTLAFAALVGFAVCGLKMWMTQQAEWGRYALACMGGFVILRLWAAWNTHRLKCPLCHGMVLHENRCRKHREAKKLPLLGYRASAVVSLLCTGLFSCMYCGTVFRLKK